jgi:Uncharacterised protein family UPF0547
MKRLRSTLLRPSVTFAFMFLGAAFVAFYPLGRDWALYVVVLVVAGLYGVRTGRRYQVTILERHETETERIWIVRQRVKKGRGRLSPEPSPEGPLAQATPSFSQAGASGVSADTKQCPDCAEPVKAEARVCRFCGYRFDNTPNTAR